MVVFVGDWWLKLVDNGVYGDNGCVAIVQRLPGAAAVAAKKKQKKIAKKKIKKRARVAGGVSCCS